MWDPVASAKAYPTREAFVRDCVPILRHEIELLRAEGVSIIQVDDPHLCLFVDPGVRAGYDNPGPGGGLCRRHGQLGCRGLQVMSVWPFILCRRAGARARGEAQYQGSYEPIMQQLRKLDVSHITMEFTTPGAGEMSVLRELPEMHRHRPGCCQHTSW